MAKEETKPRVVFKNGPEYYEAKVSRDDLEALMNGTDKVNQYTIKDVTNKIKIGEKIPSDKLLTVGAQLPFNKPIMADKGVVDRNTVIQCLEDYFDATLSYAEIYKGRFVIIEKLAIHNIGHGDHTVYLISGLAQLLKHRDDLKGKGLI